MFEKPHKQATVNTTWAIFSPQYLPELLVDVYSYCLIVKSVSSCCVNRISFPQVQSQIYFLNVYIRKSRQVVVKARRSSMRKRLLVYTTTTVNYLHGWLLYNFKMLYLSCCYTYHLVYYRSSTSY